MEIITTHSNAEFDSFSSMVAVRRFYPGAVMVFPGAQERNLHLFLEQYPHQYRFRRLRSIRLEQVERLILVDTRRADRIGRLAELVGRPGVDIHVYDHHPPTENDIRGSLEVVEETGANTTLLVELMQKRQLRITPAEATILGLGIYEDTGSLSFPSTTPRDLRAAAYLLECGMDLRVVADFISRELTPDQVSLLNDLLESREFIDIGGVRVALATASRDRFIGDLAMLAHKLKDIENLNVLFVLVKLHDRVHLVARSRLEAVDAGVVAAELGGGGHPTAASAVIRGESLAAVKDRLVDVIREKVKPVPTARGLMTASPKSIPPAALIAEAREVMGRYGIDHLPVLDDGHLAGVLHREAAERAVRHGLGKSPAGDFMTTDVETLAPGDSFYRIQELFVHHGQHFLPVVDDGRLVGAVTRSDLLGVLRDDAFLGPAHRTPEAPPFRPSRDASTLLESRLPPELVSLIGRLGEIARALGMQAFLVGGFVRDLLLNIPNLDVDVVVEGNGIDYAREVARLLGGRVRPHTRFETAVVVLPDGFKVDVATSRMEYYEQPGALPTVEHGSIKMDLFRRDFTVNALAVQLSGQGHGRLIDFFGGQRDLEEGTVRVLHDLSFVDDPTRIFRAVRFEQRLGFSIGAHTLKLLANAVTANLVETVSGPRLLGELRGILREKRPLAALRRLAELDLLRVIHPSLGKSPLDVPLLETIGEELAALPAGSTTAAHGWLLHLAALARQFTLEEIGSLTARLGMPPAPARLLAELWVEHRRLVTLLAGEEVRPSDVHRAAAGLSEEAVVFTMACSRGTPVAERLRSHLAIRESVRAPLGGEDLKVMGYPEGPLFREILQGLLDARLDGEVADADAARAWVRERYPRPRRR